MIMTRRLCSVLLMATLAVAAFVVQARVFQGVGGGSLFRPDGAGRRVYATTLQLNGGEAAVAVTAVEGGVPAVGRVLAASAPPGAVVRFTAGEGTGVGRVEAQGRAVAVLALMPGGAERALAVSVEQTLAERERSCRPAQAVGTTGIPPLPESELTCTMRNDDTRTALESRRTAVAPPAAAAYYDATLRGGGWTRLVPAGSPGRGLMVYMKDADVCCVQIGDADPRGECLVTIVRKPGAVK
jgi:hypothetical protein